MPPLIATTKLLIAHPNDEATCNFTSSAAIAVNYRTGWVYPHKVNKH